MKNLSVIRLQNALAEEYPPGTVTITSYDARAILALLSEGDAPPPEDCPDCGESACLAFLNGARETA